MRQTKVQHQESCRALRREITRFRVDIGEVQLEFQHGVVTLQGKVRPMRGNEDLFKAEIVTLIKALRSQPSVRDVIVDWREVL